jgi:hypothetical protein
MTTIDMTPTAEETVRIYAYILANHANLSPYDFGNYWSYTEAETKAIVEAFNAFSAFTDAWEASGALLKDLPQGARTKFIKSAINKAKGVK